MRAGLWSAVFAIPLVFLLVLYWGPHAHAGEQCGGASWYDYTGARTASGAPFPTNERTAAHRSLPFGTRVHVADRRTGRSTDVIINDRGPFVGGRIIDLSPTAAAALGLTGIDPVCISW